MRIFNTSSRLGQYHSLTQVLTQYQYQFQYQKCSIPIPKISSIEFPGWQSETWTLWRFSSVAISSIISLSRSFRSIENLKLFSGTPTIFTWYRWLSVRDELSFWMSFLGSLLLCIVFLRLGVLWQILELCQLVHLKAMLWMLVLHECPLINSMKP